MKDDLEQRSGYSDVWRLQAPTSCTMSQKVECEPAETNQDETIEESFDDVIVSQETQASYCLKVFLKPSVQKVL